MSDIGEAFEGMAEASAVKRSKNRESSAELLRKRGIKFEEKNGGVHLIVEGRYGPIDFWPGTGKFIARGPQVIGRVKTGRGVFNLIKLCRPPT